jgi:hypothetical protein
MQAYDLIEVYCELIVARLSIIDSQKACPIDLKEAIASVIFASMRCSDVTELADVRKQFTSKYGKEFATAALEVRPDSGVNRLVSFAAFISEFQILRKIFLVSMGMMPLLPKTTYTTMFVTGN